MGKLKINYKYLPIKAHYFFFMAAMGPILPYLPVYGKQLGVSPVVMGSVTAILPLLFLIAKPIFGFLIDYYHAWRRPIFATLLATTSACFVLMYFLPAQSGPVLPEKEFINASCYGLMSCSDMKINETDSCADPGISSSCTWSCRKAGNFSGLIYFQGDGDARLSPDSCCLPSAMNPESCLEHDLCSVTCENSGQKSNCIYRSVTFWCFVLLMSLGSIGFNVSNSISDAICFDVLGEGGEMRYGRQRVWGSIGFGTTAFLTGLAMDYWSANDTVKSYTPAFVLVTVFMILDLFFCSKLELPKMSSNDSILKDVFQLIQIKPIVIFLCFATLIGILDSFIIYFLFWYLEDLAMATGSMHEIKLIEGLIVFAENLGGEVIFFNISGKILKKIGYGYSFIFCFLCYGLRFGLISLAPTPHWVILFDLFMQGPSYAMSYTTIVAYASAVAPPGASATVQGIVAGMDDGLGFAVGSLIGGFMYREFGGCTVLKIYSAVSFVAAFAYFILYKLYLEKVIPKTKAVKKDELNDPEEAENLNANNY